MSACVAILTGIYLFLERGEEREKDQSVASHTPATGDLSHNPGFCPDCESNW